MVVEVYPWGGGEEGGIPPPRYEKIKKKPGLNGVKYPNFPVNSSFKKNVLRSLGKVQVLICCCFFLYLIHLSELQIKLFLLLKDTSIN